MGSSTAKEYAMMSGQTGGRVLPSTHFGLTTAGTGVPQIVVTSDPVTTAIDYRKAKVNDVLGSIGNPGAGLNNPGFSGGYTNSLLANQEPSLIYALPPSLYYAGVSGGGGGWGAKGGSYYAVDGAITLGTDSAGNTLYGNTEYAGGAGGKAVQTNGYAVTWLGGSDRAYGAVG